MAKPVEEMTREEMFSQLTLPQIKEYIDEITLRSQSEALMLTLTKLRIIYINKGGKRLERELLMEK